jgi:hypothetical protein
MGKPHRKKSTFYLLDDPFCTSVLHEGVVPQLKKSPPYRGPPPLRPLPADQVQPMRKMLRELLELSVIQELTPDEARSPYVHRDQSGLRQWRPPHTLRPVFSTYFLVPKKDGGARGCLEPMHAQQHPTSKKIFRIF